MGSTASPRAVVRLSACGISSTARLRAVLSAVSVFGVRCPYHVPVVSLPSTVGVLTTCPWYPEEVPMISSPCARGVRSNANNSTAIEVNTRWECTSMMAFVAGEHRTAALRVNIYLRPLVRTACRVVLGVWAVLYWSESGDRLTVDKTPSMTVASLLMFVLPRVGHPALPAKSRAAQDVCSNFLLTPRC